MRFTIELIRILLLIIILGGLGSTILFNVYSHDTVAYQYRWFGSLALLLNIFVLYRNKLQFSGWFKSDAKEALSKRWTFYLLALSILFYVLPFIISYILR